MAERLLGVQPDSLANLIEQSELAEILLIYVLHIFIYYMYV